ncbi:MAG: ATP-dependent DNA helicase RecG [Deltaproteobacteria bacterium]|nr:ATP-dependent DNA helicase RecG [Deltaproteobacteria bacterium]
MSSNPIHNIITALQKPLLFASKNNFAHLSLLKNMEPLVISLCSKALSSPISIADADNIKELQKTFEGFDRLDLHDKKDRILKGIEIVNKMTGHWSLVIGQKKDEASPHSLSIEEVKNNLKKLSTPIEYVKGIGPKVGAWFRKKGIETVLDLLYALPFRYEDRRNIKKISKLSVGVKEVAAGEIMALGEVFYGRKRIFEIAIGDGTGILKLKWFNYSGAAMKKRYKAGQRVIVFGDIGIFNNQKEIIHPDIEIIDKEESDLTDFNSIVPIYSSVGNLHQKTIRKIIKNAVAEYADYANGGAPRNILAKYSIMELPQAIKECHMPANTDCMDSKNFLARKSLIFDELFSLEFGLAIKKKDAVKESGIAFKVGTDLKSVPMVDKFISLLPFKLTSAQERVLSEIKTDMACPHPMNRLIQGDVGSGKTVVAFISALIAIDNNYQSAIMAPTEILAEQHYLNIHRFAEELGIRACLLTSSVSKSERTKMLKQIKDGEINLIIGTHALIQEDVEFNKLGIVVIDEQHRFGVVQRSLLKKKGANPDVIVMTATPIPRTLTMTVFGDLDVSVIDELPPGRKPIDTLVFRERDRQKVYQILKSELVKGRQVYIVYPLIDEKEELELKAAANMAEHLQKDIFPEYRIGLLHGRMGVKEKEDAMTAFKNKKIDILVSTTVIEVGIDVPNASVMVIEHAERFGLSQLHQLRGRVGRGGHKSFCLLLAYKIGSIDTYKRLKIMEQTNDGFKIAEEDLNIRGPGDFIGTKQSGLPDFRISNLLNDAAVLKNARDEAFKLIEQDPDLIKEEHKILKEIINARWKGRLELATIG